ncbi:hypothetical protein BD779DRAFT_1561454 [Infundibulicybe gibba]|nr:hypothetical protein BD779DRAFT_1561454 [Infundibulicybe gibba]
MSHVHAPPNITAPRSSDDMMTASMAAIQEAIPVRTGIQASSEESKSPSKLPSIEWDLLDFKKPEEDPLSKLQVISQRDGLPVHRPIPSRHSRRHSAPEFRDRHQRAPSKAFTTFCERLLMMNRLWKQEREIKALRASLESSQSAKNTNAFDAFCERLLLSNQIWKLERQVKDLHEAGEKMKRARVGVITRVAKQMVLDVRKEGLIEEFVKDLIEEVDTGKRDMAALRLEHEREIEEINGEWYRDYRKLARELENFKLNLQARLVEQQVSNDLEDSLYLGLKSNEKKVQDLEEQVSQYQQKIADGPSSGLTLRGRGNPSAPDIHRDDVSDISMSSTCISSNTYSGTFDRAGPTTNDFQVKQWRAGTRGAPPARERTASLSTTAKNMVPLRSKSIAISSKPNPVLARAEPMICTRHENKIHTSVRSRTSSIQVKRPWFP